jgi:hypothetical protein
MVCIKFKNRFPTCLKIAALGAGGMMKISIVVFLCLLNSAVYAQEPKHGFFDESVEGKPQVWNTNKGEWSSIESFWTGFAKSNNAKYWGLSDTYPNYDDVNEFDTVLIRLKEGTCLMQFFHSRWRRANDVQRWDDAFNEYAGCALVFD